MNKPCARITLDLQQASTPTFVAVKKRDIGREIRITLSDGGFPYEISADCYAVLTGTKPDGNILYNHCDIEGNTIVYTVTEQTTAAAGRMKAEVKLYGADDALVTSATFRIIVDGTVYDDDQVESEDEISALTHLVSEAAGVINEGNQMIEHGQQATQAAEAATQTANQAAEQAGNSAADANAAAAAAIQASDAAKAATDKANAAAQNADSATRLANDAANSANDAYNRAADALAEAEQAAGAGAEAVREAELALEDAAAAIAGANAAAGNANEAADRANAASVLAEQADAKVEKLREVVSKFHSNIVEEASGDVITVSDASDMELAGLRIFGKTTQNGTPTPETPVELVSVGDGGSVGVTVFGKNLIDDAPAQGVTIGSTETRVHNISGVTYVPAGIYVLSCVFQDGTNSNDTIYLNLRNESNTIVKAFRCGVPLQFDSGISVNSMDIYANSVQSGKTIKSVQLERGSTPTAYEPYTETTVTVSTPNGLPGIPVESGGNYTDSTGKQWICDEVDFEKGVYVQRIRKDIAKNLTTGYLGPKVFHAEFTTGFPAKPAKTTGEKADIMCDSLPVKSGDDQYNYGYSSVALGNTGVGYISFEGMTTLAQVNARLAEKDITIMYILAEENPISLTAEELAAYAALHTNYPNTTVFNEEGAGMEVKYVADTKLYIDKKFDQLAKAMLNQ